MEVCGNREGKLGGGGYVRARGGGALSMLALAC